MTSASERSISPHRTNETPLCTCYVSTNTPLQVGRHTQWKAPSQISGSRASMTPPSALSTGGRRGVGRRAPPHPFMFSGPSLQSVSQLKRERDALGAERRFSSMVASLPRKSAVLKGGRPFCFWTQDPPLLDHSTVGFKTPVRMVCLCAALVSLSFSLPSPVVQPTIPPLSPSKMVNIAGRGKLVATRTRLDMVSRREHNQHMATRGRSPPALVNRGLGSTSVRAPPLFSIAVSRGFMLKRANTAWFVREQHMLSTRVKVRHNHLRRPAHLNTPDSCSIPRRARKHGPAHFARASCDPPLIQWSASYLDCPLLRQRSDVG